MAGCLGIGGVSFSRCQSLSDHAKSGRFFRRSLVDCFSLFFQGHILHLDGFSKAVESVLLAANKAIILNLNQQVIAHGGLDPIEAFTNRGANMTIKLRMERQKQPEAG
jgi:hypothetical protein